MVLFEAEVPEEEAFGVQVSAVSPLSTESRKLRSISCIQDSEKDMSAWLGVPSRLKDVNRSTGAACISSM